MSDENTRIWKKVCKTDDPTTIKDVGYGARKYKAINPQSQAERATEMFGPYGMGWGLYDLRYSNYEIDGATTISLVCDFYYSYLDERREFPISADMPFKHNDDCFKKLRTECQSKALSLLGFNADVFKGQWDDVRYATEQRESAQSSSQLKDQAVKHFQKCSDLESLEKAYEKLSMLQVTGMIKQPDFELAKETYTGCKVTIRHNNLISMRDQVMAYFKALDLDVDVVLSQNGFRPWGETYTSYEEVEKLLELLSKMKVPANVDGDVDDSEPEA